MPNIHVVIKQKKEKLPNFSKQFNRLGKIIESKNRAMNALGLEVSKLKRLVNANNPKVQVKDLSNKISKIDTKIKIHPKINIPKQDVSSIKRIIIENNKSIISGVNKKVMIKPKETRGITVRSTVHTIREKLALPQITIINKTSGVVPYTG